MKFIRFLFTLCLFALPATAFAQSTTSYMDILSRPMPHATQRITYGPGQSQFGDLYLPEGKGPFPVVILIHGGCWSSGLPGVALTSYIAQNLQKSGIAVWNLEYSRIGELQYGYPGIFLDIAHGEDKLRDIAPAHNLDLAHVVLVGHSAGGHLALWAAARGKLSPKSALYIPSPLPVRAVISLSGVPDLPAYAINSTNSCASGVPKIVASQGGARGDIYADTSPAQMLPLGVPQVLFSGTLDRIVLPKFAHDYAASAKKTGDDVEDTEIPSAGHFEMVDPASAAWGVIKTEILKRL